MTPKDFERVRELFLAARELAPGARSEYLDTACGDRPDLRAEVESLLVHEAEPHDLLTAPSRHEDRRSQIERAFQTMAAPGRPARIGRYVILDTLGEGGMGIVYRAEQENPRRTVALKVIKPGAESRETLKRFEHEGQVLGWLQHPGIAQVFEAGTADTGQGPQPFFAMELVEGRPITEYARTHQLDIRRRLELMARVCDAVHHAHQKGVVHRDLKPGNIFVDAGGQPKILDFGVARATDADIRTTTLQTDVGQLIGTLAYMSPEQVAGDSSQLDTRSDIYALGVICYELLTGRVPLDVARKTIPQAARMIAEEEPTSLRSMNRAFRGDVEAIVAKALEKDKNRRYASASDLAADIRRHLSDQPISARPVTTFYQLRKFARRNRSLVAVVLIAFAALSGALMHVTWERNRAVRAERLAEQRRREAEAQRAQAEAETRKSQAINSFMQRMLASVDPAQTLGREVPFRAFLDRAAGRIETDLPDQPEVQAAVHDTLGRTYHSLGLFEDAESHLRLAVAGRRQRLGSEHPLTLRSMNKLAVTLQARGKLTEAEQFYRRVLEVEQRSSGAEHPNTILAMNNLGWLLLATGKLKEAETLLRQTLALRRRVSGADHLETLRTMVNLAGVLLKLGKRDEAESLSRQSLQACQRALGNEHPMTLYAMRERVWLLKQLRRLEEAETLGRQSLKLDRQVLGDEHALTFHSMNNLAAVLLGRGRFAEAEGLNRQTLEARRRVLGAEHPDTLASMNNLAVLLHTAGKPEQAEPLYRQVLAARRRLLGNEHPDTLSAMNNLALSLQDQGKLDEAEPLFTQVVAVRRRLLGEDHPSTLNSTRSLAALYRSQGRDENGAEGRAVPPTTKPSTPEDSPDPGTQHETDD